MGQQPGSYRRLFADSDIDLYLWYSRRRGRLRGFQLVYDKGCDCHALTWTRQVGFEHHKVQDADRTMVHRAIQIYSTIQGGR